MNPWDSYQSRLDAHGATMRERMVKRERNLLSRRIGGSLSYKELKIDGADRNAAVISTDIMTQKRICSLPGEDFPNGAYVEFADSHWLITTVDADHELYTKGTMIQCNYLLKWVNSDNQVVERWCILEDTTKLKHKALCNSLVGRKRPSKRTPLYAGTPLEPCYQNGAANSRKRQRFEKYMDWEISREPSNRGPLNDYPGRGSTPKRVEMGSPNPRNVRGMVKI